MKKTLSILMCLFVLVACASSNTEEIKNEVVTNEGETLISLNGNKALINGESIKEYDYVWNYSPNDLEPYYTGTEPSGDIYIAHDIIYYPEVPQDSYSLINYDGENEWVTYFTNENSNYIFGTLPNFENRFEMMHSSKEAYDNPVLHINAAGTYRITGEWNGQIYIDLGKDASVDENQKVVLILDGVDVTCTVAPALIFRNVYECDNDWKNRSEYSGEVDLSDAGAKVVLVDGTENNFTGTNIFRLLKPTYKKEGSTVQKKLVKNDGAFYSYMSMVIESETKGTGILNITSTTYEGLDSELHLTINSGYINIVSQDDGINVNEDGVSVLTVNGGHLTIFAGQGSEGDVVDSNGFITINGGFIAGTSPSPSDQMLDSDSGTTVSENATVISSTSGGMMNGNHMGGFDKAEGFGGFERPEGMEGFNPFDRGPRESGDFNPSEFNKEPRPMN